MPRKSKPNNQRSDIKARTNIRSDQKMQATMALLDHKLTGAAIKVGLYLINLHNNEYGYAWPTFEQIMKKCHLRRETVNDALKLLRARGVVMSVTKGNNRYYMAWDDLLSPAVAAVGEYRKPALLEVPKTVTDGVRKPAPYTSYDTDYRHSLHDTPDAAASGSDGDVLNSSGPATQSQPQAGNDNWPANAADQFWELYPYEEYRYDQSDRNGRLSEEAEDFRLSKIELRRLRNRSVPFESVTYGVARYWDRIREQGLDYILSPQKWLRNGHWEDDYGSSSEAA